MEPCCDQLSDRTFRHSIKLDTLKSAEPNESIESVNFAVHFDELKTVLAFNLRIYPNYKLERVKKGVIMMKLGLLRNEAISSVLPDKLAFRTQMFFVDKRGRHVWDYDVLDLTLEGDQQEPCHFEDFLGNVDALNKKAFQSECLDFGVVIIVKHEEIDPTQRIYNATKGGPISRRSDKTGKILWESQGKHSDFTIKSGKDGSTFPAHKTILQFFGGAFFEGLFRNDYEEKIRREVKLKYSGSVLKKILEFIYTGEMTELPNDIEDISEIMACSRMLMLDSVEHDIQLHVITMLEKNEKGESELMKIWEFAHVNGFETVKNMFLSYFLIPTEVKHDMVKLMKEAVISKDAGHEVLSVLADYQKLSTNSSLF